MAVPRRYQAQADAQSARLSSDSTAFQPAPPREAVPPVAPPCGGPVVETDHEVDVPEPYARELSVLNAAIHALRDVAVTIPGAMRARAVVLRDGMGKDLLPLLGTSGMSDLRDTIDAATRGRVGDLENYVGGILVHLRDAVELLSGTCLVLEVCDAPADEQ